MIAGVLALAAVSALAVVGWRRFADRDPHRAALTGCAADADLRITAAPDIAPLVSAAADTLAEPGRCGPVAVIVEEPEITARTIAARPPEAWVPPSSAWLHIAARGSDYPGHGNSLARSPVVVAAPRGYATTLGWPDRQPTWTDLANRTYTREIPRFSVPDPQRDTDGLLTVLGVRAATARGTADEGIAEMRTLTFRSRLADPNADPAALLRRTEGEPDPLRTVGLFPVREQALFTHLTTTKSPGLVALYPADGLVEADYPLAVSARTASNARRQALADQVVSWLRSEGGVRALVERGFRPAVEATSTATPKADGILPGYAAPVLPPTDGAQIVGAAAAWARYRQLAFQVLLLIDASGSMNDQVRDRSGATTTKADLLRRAGAQAVQLFGAETSIGMWLFGTPTPTSPPFVEAVPFGPLSDDVQGVSRRELLARAAATYRPNPAAGTPLYESVLRGIAAMRQRVRPDALTLVVVLTDGKDEDSPYTMTAPSFLAKLAAGGSSRAPVPVFCIGYGTDADMGALNQIATRTGGRAVASNDPGDLASAIAQVFLAAHQPGR